MPDTADSSPTLDFHGLPVLHLFQQFETIGGVEAVLKLHRAHDPKVNVKSDILIYSDPPAASGERLHCLGINPDQSLRAIGRRFRKVTASRTERIAIYHLAWGFRFFCPHDFASRRILVIHSKEGGLLRFLPNNAGFLDGILCVSREIHDFVAEIIPSFPRDRIMVIGCPIDPPPPPEIRPGLKSPIQLGYIGRLQLEQKRVDRIPTFCAILKEAGLDYQFEILGSGINQEVLTPVANEHKLCLRGDLRGENYWKLVRELDLLLFFSDYEGTPLGLLEALSQGVIPIYPAINTGGDKYVAAVDPGLLYPAGDLRAAAQIVRELSASSPERIAELRQRSQHAVRSHTLENYFRDTFGFASRISKLERISRKSSLSSKLTQFLTIRQIHEIKKRFSGPR